MMNRRKDTGTKPQTRAHRTAVALSWAAVAAVAAMIFLMSAKDGTTLDTDSGLITAVKNWLASAALALFGHPVDVSPVGHFAEFFLFGCVLANALRWHMPLRRCPWMAAALASIYGVTDEFHQLFVPMRSCDPADWAVDTVAALVGALIATAVLQRRRNLRAADRSDADSA